jgi:DNA-binding NtrC family response regulator
MLDGEKAIAFHHLPPAFQSRAMQNKLNHWNGENISNTSGTSLEEQIEHLEKTLIQSALQQSNGNVTKAADLLSISRQRLNYKMKKYNL